jgi:ubiquinone/menaquinone biosynthesis C-methylase UbiE
MTMGAEAAVDVGHGPDQHRAPPGPDRSLPLEDESIDVVISNGVIDLIPDTDPVFAEIDRVLRPGGRLQLADVFIRHEVSEDARKGIDL